MLLIKKDIPQSRISFFYFVDFGRLKIKDWIIVMIEPVKKYNPKANGVPIVIENMANGK